MGELVSVAKFGEFLEAELRAIVAWDTIPGKQSVNHALNCC